MNNDHGRRLVRFIGVLICGFLLTACQSATNSSLEQAAQSPRAQTEGVAQAAFSIGDYAEAARLYEMALQKQPNSIISLIGLGKSYTALGQYSRARNALESAKRLRPSNPDIHSSLGKLALYQGDGESAYAHYRRALQLAPRDLAGLTGAAAALDYLSRHAEAQTIYQRALRIYPTNFALLSNYALSRAIAGEYEAASAVLEELSQDAYQGNVARANLAIVYVLADRTGDARSILKGIMNPSEINYEIGLWQTARQKRLAGEKIGHLIFQ